MSVPATSQPSRKRHALAGRPSQHSPLLLLTLALNPSPNPSQTLTLTLALIKRHHLPPLSSDCAATCTARVSRKSTPPQSACWACFHRTTALHGGCMTWRAATRRLRACPMSVPSHGRWWGCMWRALWHRVQVRGGGAVPRHAELACWRVGACLDYVT
jgi:hypothetical protein